MFQKFILFNLFAIILMKIEVTSHQDSGNRLKSLHGKKNCSGKRYSPWPSCEYMTPHDYCHHIVRRKRVKESMICMIKHLFTMILFFFYVCSREELYITGKQILSMSYQGRMWRWWDLPSRHTKNCRNTRHWTKFWREKIP